MTTVFWNVDTQFDFMRKKGKLYVPDAEKIEPALRKLTGLAASYGLIVINTADSHDKDSHELSATPNFTTTFPEHCMYGTSGADFVPATRPENAYVLDWREKTLDGKLVAAHRNIVLTKDDFDVFHKTHGSPHAAAVLELLKPKRVFVYGVAANVCVDFAVRGLLERKLDVYVVQDAVKGLPGIPDPVPGWVGKGAKLVEAATLEHYLK